ncbi:hypothetical protein [Mesorhizobium sp. Root695]|jgi:hypothetical protein|uniref:hypothetical protein n=1 Tax=Mesorhizobium sp. Root695 TaxID=1736589 RepID=UPI000A82012D|nr:hypothetical protein [Mesorhizobium sp. Root695]
MVIESLVLRPDAIGGTEIFKLPERADRVRISEIYLQETIVRRIGELGLKGIAFNMVWSDEPVRQDRIEYPCVAKDISPASSLNRLWAGLRRRAGL